MSALSAICARFGVKAEARYDGRATVPEGFPPGTVAWRVRLTMRHDGARRSLTVPFFTGPAISREPSAADVLSCLTSDTRAGEQSFAEFCGDFGYDPDSRKAEATHRACARVAPKVRAFLGEHFDTFANAEH